MNIGIIGLGLIGGSVAKAISEKTNHTVKGFDKENSIICRAKLLGAISDKLSLQNPSECDIIILALYPKASIEVFEQIAPLLKRGTIVIDCGGIKELVCEAVKPSADKYGINFIGGHPMAGIEKIGFEYSNSEIFKNASMILTPYADTDIKTLAFVKEFFLDIGFGYTTIVTPKEHDEIIAYTSQLAHILSSAYIKSPTAPRHKGLSAGSFRDMTRVAYLNEYMWSELFMENRENLIFEIDTLIKNLSDFKEAITCADKEQLTELLRDGRIKKENI